jgi:hypothetical protein
MAQSTCLLLLCLQPFVGYLALMGEDEQKAFGYSIRPVSTKTT